MIPFGLTLAFIVEVVVAIVVCAWSWNNLVIANIPIGMIAVIVVLVGIAARLALVLFEFILAYLWKSPREKEMRVGFVGGLYLLLSELFCFLLVSALLLPFSRKLVALRRSSVTTSKRTPVLLIHGYGTNAGIWSPMIAYLWNRGLSNIFTLNLMPKGGDLDDYAQQVAARVNRILESTRAKRVILIGHGLGGLVARAYVQHCGGADKVERVVAIGTPNHGTLLARLVPGVGAAQMRVGSRWLQELNQGESWPTEIQYVSIFSRHDNVVIPQASAQLGVAKNVAVKGKGHFGLLFSREVGQLVYREIVEGA